MKYSDAKRILLLARESGFIRKALPGFPSTHEKPFIKVYNVYQYSYRAMITWRELELAFETDMIKRFFQMHNEIIYMQMESRFVEEQKQQHEQFMDKLAELKRY